MGQKDSTVLLQIPIVGTGFYRGFNAVVSVTTKVLLAGLVVLLITWPHVSEHVLASFERFTLSKFANWYVYLLAAFVFFNGLLVFLPISGRIRLGPDGAKPEHSTMAWLSMMCCSGVGIGILVFSVSEPISDFISNPKILSGTVRPESAAAAPAAMQFVFLHWGLSAWCTYSVIALALGLSCHRFGQPMTIRSTIAPIFGRRLEGLAGHLVDVLSLMAIIAGITTTIVFGLQEICTGLSTLTGSSVFADHAGNPPLTALLTALIVAIAVASASIISGPHRGVKWVSQLGILIAFGVFLVFVTFGGRGAVVPLLFGAGYHYILNLPTEITTLYRIGPARNWQNEWTIFYWAWWISFAPFVGLFLARISFGRTVREFIIGATLAPTIMCIVWFSGTGGSALLMELDGRAGGSIVQAEHSFRIYAAVRVMLPSVASMFVDGVLVLLFLLLVVASTTAAIMAVKSIGAAGSPHGETPFHSCLWAVIIAAITGAVMAVGGSDAIRAVMIIGAAPFSLVMAMMLIAVILMLRNAARALDTS